MPTMISLQHIHQHYSKRADIHVALRQSGWRNMTRSSALLQASYMYE